MQNRLPAHSDHEYLAPGQQTDPAAEPRAVPTRTTREIPEIPEMQEIPETREIREAPEMRETPEIRVIQAPRTSRKLQFLSRTSLSSRRIRRQNPKPTRYRTRTHLRESLFLRQHRAPSREQGQDLRPEPRFSQVISAIPATSWLRPGRKRKKNSRVWNLISRSLILRSRKPRRRWKRAWSPQIWTVLSRRPEIRNLLRQTEAHS